jgi:hypothetical protein
MYLREVTPLWQAGPGPLSYGHVADTFLSPFMLFRFPSRFSLVATP